MKKHLESPDADESPQDAADQKPIIEEKIDKSSVKDGEDVQLKRALELLKGWEIFKEKYMEKAS